MTASDAQINKASTFLQWKGTDVCLDFYCACGNQFHVHGYFAYYIVCLACKSAYEMPSDLAPVKVDKPIEDAVYGDQLEDK